MRAPVVRGLTGAAVALAAGKAWRSRDRLPAFRNTLRAFNRRWFNPVMLRFAGNSPWFVARLEHLGRRSRRSYATPVLAWPMSGGFFLPMPYGTDVDWAHNLRHASEAVLQHQGVRYRIGNPRIVTVTEARPELPSGISRIAALSGIRDVMRVDVLPSLTPTVSLSA